MKKFALPFSLIAAAMALTACGGASTEEPQSPEASTNASAPAASSQAPESSAPASSQAPESSAPADGSGTTAASLEIDGKTVKLAGKPKCVAGGDKVSMVYPDGSLSVAITTGAKPALEALSYTNAKDGTTLVVLPSMKQGKATVTEGGGAYVVEGTGTDTTGSQVPFKLSFDC